MTRKSAAVGSRANASRLLDHPRKEEEEKEAVSDLIYRLFLHVGSYLSLMPTHNQYSAKREARGKIHLYRPPKRWGVMIRLHTNNYKKKLKRK